VGDGHASGHAHTVGHALKCSCARALRAARWPPCFFARSGEPYAQAGDGCGTEPRTYVRGSGVHSRSGGGRSQRGGKSSLSMPFS